MTTTTTPRTSPADGLAEVGTKRMLLLGLLGALKALGIVLVADALAAGIVAVIGHGDVAIPVIEGLAGALVRAVSLWGLRVASQSTAAGVKRNLRERAARAMLDRSGEGVGAETTVVTTGLDDLDAYYTSYLPSLVTAATVPLLVGARILAADWVSALVIVITVPLVPLFMALIGMHTRDRVAASLDALGRLSDHLVELACGLPVLVGLGRDREQARALADISDDHRVRSMTALRTAFLSALALDLLSTISVAIVAVLVGIRLLNGQLTLEAGLVALILAPECYAPIREIGAAFHASDTGREALRRVRAVFERTPLRNAVTALTSSTLVVHDLSVRYRQRNETAVRSLSFTAKPHRITLLSGASGTGKSTVLSVLACRGALLEPDATVSGELLLPPSDTTVWMPQHPRFSSATLADEVALYGAPEVDAVALLGRVGLAVLAGRSPDELSPGEARRLAFTRVLAAVDTGATLVLLDEPTAHLDPGSAVHVRREIAELRGRATVVLASHDPALQDLADEVVAVGASTRSRRPLPARCETDGEEETTSAPLRLAAAAESAAHRGRPTGRRAIAELAAFLRPVRWRMVAAVSVGILSTAFAVALTAVSGWLIVRASQEPAIMYLLVAIVGVRFFGIGRSALRYAERLLTHDAVLRAVTGLRLRLWRGLAAKGPAGRSALSPANTLRTLVGAADRVRDLMPRVVQPAITAAVVFVGALVTLWLIFPPAAALIGGCGAIALLVAPAVAAVGGRIAARRGEVARSAVLTAFTGLLIARDDLTPRAAGGVLARIRRADLAASASERRAAFVEGAASALVVLACCATAVTVLPLVAATVASGTLRPDAVAVLALVPLALIEPFTDGVAAAAKALALAEVLGTVAEASAASAAEHAQASGRAPTIDGIGLDDVAFSYDGTDHAVFDHVSAAVGKGQWLAVTGPSGSGKSTLLALLLRFIDPGEGSYRLVSENEAMDASTVSPHSLRTRVAWCPQDGHLFDSTLRANLAIARGRDDRPTDTEMTEALARVGLAPLVATLPDGLDTRIGPGGSRLSGGQRQRLAVARTLLTRGDVVLIDEPTAQLDEQASAELMADLRGALTDAVTVLVTHDAEEARVADRLILLGGPGASARDTSQGEVPAAA
ncbi:thiol reductant ABC exporter subunit CydC [Humibacter sp. RRB41]|uniref:thiol reductant ABC exporter subunit CydC n=1 Tax=Humibacter sp. RRB41 TaxID=2919946 RepID=UPI001FAA585E|nr:thiol reductant ABC exporter subunit CydC [Humibacter sp. RRB41]